jgi:hypothetical protein
MNVFQSKAVQIKIRASSVDNYFYGKNMKYWVCLPRLVRKALTRAVVLFHTRFNSIKARGFVEFVRL